LKKNDEIGMPAAIKDIVNVLAELQQSTSEEIESLVQSNFMRLTADDSGFAKSKGDYSVRARTNEL
jgi:hypothetical protein